MVVYGHYNIEYINFIYLFRSHVVFFLIFWNGKFRFWSMQNNSHLMLLSSRPSFIVGIFDEQKLVLLLNLYNGLFSVRSLFVSIGEKTKWFIYTFSTVWIIIHLNFLFRLLSYSPNWFESVVLIITDWKHNYNLIWLIIN